MAANTEHPACPQPPSGDARLWRYMDFAKFASLLDTRRLHFARADLLGDPFEGSYSRNNLTLRPEVYKGLENSATVFEAMGKFSMWIREWTFANCWHMNEQESAAMWSLYAMSNQAVAITCSYSRLAACLPDDVFLGTVQYIDYEAEWLPEGNSLYPFMHKRRSFEHEREVRALLQEFPSEGDMLRVGLANPDTGRSVPIDLADLVEAVYVASTLPTR